uniref:Uncharacterized protein n=1 Tax=Anguilla anguilla TaxID=7936 RepID=A0A0E9RVB4_ANGAN
MQSLFLRVDIFIYIFYFILHYREIWQEKSNAVLIL